jgi:dTDP-4-dehydrorhamnose reductase
VSASLKFLVLGCDGQVGASFIQLLQSRKVPFKGLTTEDSLKPSELKNFMSSASDFPYVINAVFEEPQEDDALNLKQWIETGKAIAKYCQSHRQILFQLSSGLVFSGRSSRPYLENDETDAQSELGRTFIELERLANSHCEQTLILRAGWVFSEQVGNYLTRLVGAAISQESLSFSGRLKGCPTDAHAVARVLLAMAEQVDCRVSEPVLWGTYHYADSDACSMFTFAKTVITVVKSMTEVRVETIQENDLPNMVDAVVEPENYELNCKKILSSFGIKQRPWRRSIHEVLKEKFASVV